MSRPSEASVIRRHFADLDEHDLGCMAEYVRDALEGDSNDAEHDALVCVADSLGIDWLVPDE